MMARLADRLALVVMGVIFCAAIVVLIREFRGVTLGEVLDRLSAMPPQRVAAAIMLTTASYLLLTGYDFLALRYVGHRLPLRDVIFASFAAFVLSNNVGFHVLSGGSVRYRVYSRLGLNAVAVGEVLVFLSFAYALGVVTVGGVLMLSDRSAFAALLHVPRLLVGAGGAILLSISVGYLAIATFWRQPIAIGRYQLRPPSLPLAVAQVVLASVDAVLAATVMYVLLPADMAFSYQYFLGVYTIAATASILSLVPGGLGVFETGVTLLVASPSKAATLGVFFVYRLVYFILPLLVALAWFGLRALRRRQRLAPDSDCR